MDIHGHKAIPLESETFILSLPMILTNHGYSCFGKETNRMKTAPLAFMVSKVHSIEKRNAKNKFTVSADTKCSSGRTCASVSAIAIWLDNEASIDSTMKDKKHLNKVIFSFEDANYHPINQNLVISDPNYGNKMGGFVLDFGDLCNGYSGRLSTAKDAIGKCDVSKFLGKRSPISDDKYLEVSNTEIETQLVCVKGYGLMELQYWQIN